MTRLRAHLGLPPEEAPRNKHSDRLVSCMHSIVRLVPDAAAGIATPASVAATGVGSSGNPMNLAQEGITFPLLLSCQFKCLLVTISTVNGRPSLQHYNAHSSPAGVELDRDPYSGKLTPHGRARLLEGKVRCRVGDVLQPRALTRDPLECPLCSYEFAPLARLLICLSQALNSELMLPLNDRQMIMCSWQTVLQRAKEEASTTAAAATAGAEGGRRDYFYPIRAVQQCFRFNLRFLAYHRVMAVYMFVLSVLSYRSSCIPLPLLLVVSLLCGYVLYHNGFRLKF